MAAAAPLAVVAATKKRKVAVPEPQSVEVLGLLETTLTEVEQLSVLVFVQKDTRWTDALGDCVDVEFHVGRDVIKAKECYTNLYCCRVFYCHSTILKLASPVWKDALTGSVDNETKRHTIELPTTSPWAMTLLLESIYPQYLRPNLARTPPTLLRELLSLAWRYEVMNVMTDIAGHLKTTSDFRSSLLLDTLTGKHQSEHWTDKTYTAMTEYIKTEIQAARIKDLKTLDSVLNALPAIVRARMVWSLMREAPVRFGSVVQFPDVPES